MRFFILLHLKYVSLLRYKNCAQDIVPGCLIIIYLIKRILKIYFFEHVWNQFDRRRELKKSVD